MILISNLSVEYAMDIFTAILDNNVQQTWSPHELFYFIIQNNFSIQRYHCMQISSSSSTGSWSSTRHSFLSRGNGGPLPLLSLEYTGWPHRLRRSGSNVPKGRGLRGACRIFSNIFRIRTGPSLFLKKSSPKRRTVSYMRPRAITVH